MANPTIYYANPSTYTLAASLGSDASHPTTYLQDFLRGSYWMSAQQVAGQTLRVALPAAQSCDYAIIDGHNMAGWVFRIEGADDSAHTTNNEVVFSGYLPAAPSLIVFTGGAITRRYWRFTLGDTGTTPEIPYIGNLFIGKVLTFSFPHDFGPRMADSSFQSTTGRSLSGVKRSSQMVGGTRVFDMAFSLISDAVATAFRTFHDTVRGGLRPFYYSPDGGTTLYYVSLQKDYNPIIQYRPGQNNIQQLTMETADSDVI